MDLIYMLFSSCRLDTSASEYVMFCTSSAVSYYRHKGNLWGFCCRGVLVPCVTWKVIGNAMSYHIHIIRLRSVGNAMVCWKLSSTLVLGTPKLIQDYLPNTLHRVMDTFNWTWNPQITNPVLQEISLTNCSYTSPWQLDRSVHSVHAGHNSSIHPSKLSASNAFRQGATTITGLKETLFRREVQVVRQF